MKTFDVLEDSLWIEVNMKVAFYQPEIIKKGMLFINSLYPNTDREFVEIWKLEEDIPEEENNDFFQKNGFPVEIMLTIEQSNPDEPDDIVVFPNNIGYLYNDSNEEVFDLDIKMMNNIIQDYGGNVFLLIEENDYLFDYTIIPKQLNDKVILTYPYYDDEENEEYFESLI
jgi:hypothetical protein